MCVCVCVCVCVNIQKGNFHRIHMIHLTHKNHAALKENSLTQIHWKNFNPASQRDSINRGNYLS